MDTTPQISWKELHGLVEEHGVLLVNEDDRGYMEVRVPDDFDTKNKNLWRNTHSSGQVDMHDLLCLHFSVPGPYADEHESIDVELPAEYPIVIDEFGCVLLPYGFNQEGSVKDFLILTFLRCRELLPVRDVGTGKLLLMTKDSELDTLVQELNALEQAAHANDEESHS